MKITKEVLKELIEYISLHTAIEIISENDCLDIVCEKVHSYEIESFIDENIKPSFNEVLFNFINEKGLNDLQVYKKAGIDRRHFSKIRSRFDYTTKKNTVISLALAMELDKAETSKLLKAAGYSLSENSTYDLVIMFCIEKKIYNIHDVNLALDHFSLKIL